MSAITMVLNPRLTSQWRNRVASDAPSTISGVVSGRTSRKFSPPLPRNLYRASAMAISEPRMVAITVEMAATFRLTMNASVSDGRRTGPSSCRA